MPHKHEVNTAPYLNGHLALDEARNPLHKSLGAVTQTLRTVLDFLLFESPQVGVTTSLTSLLFKIDTQSIWSGR